MSKPLGFKLAEPPAKAAAEETPEDASVRERVLAALNDPRPVLSTEELRSAMERHHAQAMKAHGKS